MSKKGIIIVRYENEIDSFIERLELLSKDFNVFIYDNSPKSIQNLIPEKIYYYHDKSNSGIGVGINHCLKEACKIDISICSYFDQDSDVTSNLINKLQTRYIELKKEYNNLFILSPQPMISKDEPYPITYISELSDTLVEASEVITSGMTFNTKEFIDIGIFNEELYLDLVDFEICWRARENNKLIIVDKKIEMNHEVGISTLKLPFIKLPISTPWRNYYQTRNALFLLFNNKNIGLGFKLYKTSRRIFNILLSVIFMNKRFQRLKYHFLGINHALKGKMGRCENLF